MIFVLLFVALLIAGFFIAGKLLDMEAERLIDQCYPRNKEGIIDGAESFYRINQKKKALILFHGYLTSPAIFQDLANENGLNNHYDIYAPLLPYCGRDLKACKKLTPQIAMNFMQKKIEGLSKQYESVVVLAFSYSGTCMIKLMKERLVPENCRVVLYSPIIFTSRNTFLFRGYLFLYSFWRKYCNYEVMGANLPDYCTGDEEIRSYLEYRISLRYQVLPPLIKIMKLAGEIKRDFFKLERSFSLIAAKNDTVVNFEKIKEACEKNPNAHLHAIMEGKHLCHLGKDKENFKKLLIQIGEGEIE